MFAVTETLAYNQIEIVLKILLLAPQPFYQERGTPIAVKLLAQSLAEMNHEIHLLVFNEGDDIDLPGVDLYRHMKIPGITGIKPGFSIKKLFCDLFLFLKLIELVRKNEYDLIHSVEESVFMAFLVKKIYKIPYVYDMDSCLSAQLTEKYSALGCLRRPMEWMEKAVISSSNGVLPVCESLKNVVRRLVPDIPVACLEDISLLAKGSTGTEDLRKELEISGTVVMYVGNFEKYQGIDLLLTSFVKVLENRDDIYLLLIGGNEHDIDNYRDKIERFGVSEKVIFCGGRPVNQLGYYLKQADILISPRVKGSNTPMKIYSYLDSGVAVVATRLETHTQVLDDNISCLVDCTPESMAEGLLYLADNKTERQAIASRARKHVQENYSLPAFKRKLSNFYEKLQSNI